VTISIQGLLTEAAQENFVIYGFFGTSGFVEVGGLNWATIASERLVRADWIVIFTVGDRRTRSSLNAAMERLIDSDRQSS
jgi:hypothetical protein